jgi:hypothetical protein
MKREALKRLIRNSIQTVSNEYLTHLAKQQDISNTDKFLNSDNISEEDFDSHLFFGGVEDPALKKHKNSIFIQEGTDSSLKITSSEIKDFENSFKQILDSVPGATIVFDRQKNGYSISAVKRSDGVEAKASGILNLGDNGKITWSYSILNGFNINAQNLKLSDDNKTMFEALTNHYNDWQKNWRNKLNLPSAPQEEDGGENQLGTQQPSAPPVGGLEGGPATGGAAPSGGGEIPAPSI